MSSSTIPQEQETKPPNDRITQFCLGVAKVAGGTILGISMLASSIVAGGLVGLAISFRNLPDVRLLRNYVPNETSYIYDIKGRPLASIHGEENREVVALDNISPELKQAVIAIEDSRFYHHKGINPYSIARALVVNVQEGEVVEGASTLTMQLVKNLLLSRERTFTRKLAEAILAMRIEQVFSKDEILEMYLNNIYWGHNNYGVQTAAETYFNKSAAELDLAEAAMMAGIIQAPEKYSPFINYQNTKRRQAIVLKRMADLGWIDVNQSQAALKEPLLVGRPTAWKQSKSPFVTEGVITELKERFGEEIVLKGGMRIQTTVDYYYQRKAEEIVQKEHRQLHSRGVYADQIALVAIDPRTHFVKALVGGVNYDKSQFNRAVQALRQPGSAFKPFVYYLAFASGKFTPYTTIEDKKERYWDGQDYYTPKNYGDKYSGTVSIRAALTRSLNAAAVKMGQEVGLDNVIELCRRLGIKSPLQPVISLPLGAVGITPLEMTGAYATFASNGWHSDPTIVARVTDVHGNILLDNIEPPELVLDQWAVASLNSVLQGVITEGTGRAAQIGRPAAGKTGTTSSERDVWFIGYVPQLAVSVWIGNDDYRSLGKGITGGQFAAPIWREYMLEILKNEPVRYFPSPSRFNRPKPSEAD